MLAETPAIILSMIGAVEGQRILNLGSSTWEFYHDQQPFIWRELMRPLAKAGNKIVNFDQKTGDGVDVMGDAHSLEYPKGTFDGCLCCSLLEHVLDPRRVLDEIRRVLTPQGWLVADVPSDYPYHPDPIDTGLRISDMAGWYDLFGDRFELLKFQAVGSQATVVYALRRMYA